MREEGVDDGQVVVVVDDDGCGNELTSVDKSFSAIVEGCTCTVVVCAFSASNLEGIKRLVLNLLNS